jgi:4-alpha-glucanotransferase
VRAIFPLQNLLAMDGGLRCADPHEEQTNVPGNPTHFWKYCLPLEELVNAISVTEPLREIAWASGR